MLELDSGTMLAGRYRLDHELGRGGMGAVWAADDQKLRRPVAVKVMTERINDSEQAISRFEREAMAVARLRSPHIVEVHDYGIDQGCPYIVMELLQGRDLKALLEKERRLTLERTAPIIMQVAKALHAAHAARIIHRDLKPANVFLATEHGDTIAKVFDFGVAKAQIGEDTDATAEGVLLGTPRYMSPEQAYGAKRLDHRSDLWSLGVIVYQCVTGRLPFIAPGQGHVLVKICTEDHPRPSELLPYLGAEGDAFFAKALAKKPEDRFQSAIELATELAKLANVAVPSSLESLVSVGMPIEEDPLDDVAGDLSERRNKHANDPTRSYSGSLKSGAVSGTLPSAGMRGETTADSPEALRSSSDASSGGTLGPATTSLAAHRGWLASRGRRIGLAALAIAAASAAAFAATRVSSTALFDGSGPKGPEGPSAAAEVPPRGPADSTAAPEPESPRAQPSAEQARERDGALDRDETEADDPDATRGSKRPRGQTKSGARARKAGDKGTSQDAKEAAKTSSEEAPPSTPEPDKPPVNKPETKKPAGAEDGLDMFNKRW